MIVARCNFCGGELECEIYDKQSQNSLQLLKAEILPILNEALESLRLGDLDDGENLINQVTAKLSAVQ